MSGEDVLARVTQVVTDELEPQRDEDVWAMLDRQPDRYHPKTGELVSEGRAKPTKAYVKLVMEQDHRLQAQFRHNEFTGLVEINGDACSDVAETGIACFLSQVYDLDMATPTVAELIRWRATRLRYNPMVDYLRQLQWDGTERLSTWLSTYLGAAQTDLNAHIGVKWAISAVARVMRPGCKVDTVLILTGPQGARKSSAFRVLAGVENFSDSTVDLRSKDAYAMLQGKWVVEFAELDNVRRREATAVKAFLTSAIDRYRPAYGRNPIEWKRQCVIVGTTNEATFLSDATGSRRFWPVEVGAVDLDRLDDIRHQIWAEAVVRYDQGQPWWLDDVTEQARAEESERFATDDPWLEVIAAHLSGRQETTVRAVLAEAVKMDIEKMNRASEMRVASLLGQLGWTKSGRKRIAGRLVVPWQAPTAPPATDNDTGAVLRG
jgi:putative DNA primase/helicase